jgi:UTP:GlnB (protein PII) uridylyltransferase
MPTSMQDMQKIKTILTEHIWNIKIKIWTAQRTVSQTWLEILQDLLN